MVVGLHLCVLINCMTVEYCKSLEWFSHGF